MNRGNRFFFLTATLVLCASTASASTFSFPVTIDFSTDAAGAPLPNGQAITEPPTGNTDIETDAQGTMSGSLAEGDGQQLVSVSPLFTITTTGDEHVGAVVFDSNPAGPNTADDDLLVDQGNVLILQEDNDVPGIDIDDNGVFAVPDDDTNPGSIFFNFVDPVELLSIDLVDVNGGAEVTLTLTDEAGLERVFSVTEQFTFDIADDPGEIGVATLLLTTLDDQIGVRPGEGDPATATEDAGFDPTSVTTLEVAFGGASPSAAIDNLVIGGLTTAEVPEPVSLVLLLGALVGAGRARRR